MAKKKLPSCSSLEISQWHERDRNHVSAQTPKGKTVGDWWDEAVHSMVEDGFFKAGRLPRSGIDESSVREYLRDIGACNGGGLGRSRRRR